MTSVDHAVRARVRVRLRVRVRGRGHLGRVVVGSARALQRGRVPRGRGRVRVR